MLYELRMRPIGPWRTGERVGDRERVDAIYHSDALYSAVTHAMSALGHLEPWLDATARPSVAPGGKLPAVRFGSLFAFAGPHRLAPPPRNAWPPATQTKLYLHAAKLVPSKSSSAGSTTTRAGWWMAFGVPAARRRNTAIYGFVARRRGSRPPDWPDEPHRTACLEFAPDAGWWVWLKLIRTLRAMIGSRA